MPDVRKDSFSHLFSESGEVLRRYVRRLVGSRETTDEIVQESFLRTFEHRNEVQTPRAFLFTVARNLASKSRRHARVVEATPFGEFDVAGGYAEHQSPEERLLADERLQLLKQAVERLPAQRRAALTLKVFHDCSYQEIADRLGVCRKTVEKHISLGLREIHNHFQCRYTD